jgi:hypothetical protein
MALDSIQTNDIVAILTDIVEPEVVRGKIGLVTRVIDADRIEVVFRDDNFKIIDPVQLRKDQLVVLSHDDNFDEQDFWELIEHTRLASDGVIGRQAELLVKHLVERSMSDIVRFGELYIKFERQAYQRELWAAAYVICGGCGDDGFSDFCYWLIAQGKSIYDDALRDPETLVDLIDLRADEGGTYGDFDLDGIDSVAGDAFQQKTGQPLCIWLDIPPEAQLTGEEWTDQTVYLKYPRLTAKFNPSYRPPR